MIGAGTQPVPSPTRPDSSSSARKRCKTNGFDPSVSASHSPAGSAATELPSFAVIATLTPPTSKPVLAEPVVALRLFFPPAKEGQAFDKLRPDGERRFRKTREKLNSGPTPPPRRSARQHGARHARAAR